MFLVNFLAVRPDWAPVPRVQDATAGESHQSEGIRTTRGRPGGQCCSLADRSSGRRTAGSTFVRVGNPTWLKPIANPAKRSLGQSLLIAAKLILPEIQRFMQDHMHVHLYRADHSCAGHWFFGRTSCAEIRLAWRDARPVAAPAPSVTQSSHG
jgi:hypothetical protein